MNYIKHIPLALLVCFCLKYLVLPATYIDIAFLAILASTSSFFENHSFNKELKKLAESIVTQQKEFSHKSKEIDELKSALASLKLGQSMSMRSTKLG